MPDYIASQDAQYALDLVTRICTEVGPGLPGSPQERARAEILRQELQTHLGGENVHSEEFSLAPEAFLGVVPLSALFTGLAAASNVALGRFPGIPLWFGAVAGLTFSLLAILPVILEFIFYREAVDPFFKKKPSLNVIGSLRKPGGGEVKRLLIFSGHHDSALENTWLRLLGYGFFVSPAIGLLGMLTMLSLSALQCAGALSGDLALIRMGTLGWPLFAFPVVPSIVFGAFFTRGRKNGGNVPGAADNLSACAVTVALARYLARRPELIPEDTEIRFICFGSEEAGLRGSRSYVKRHLDELRRLDARLLNFETIAHPLIAILDSDVNGTVRNSPQMVAGVVAAAERAGVPYQVKPYTLGTGASDAGPFSQAGLQALTLLPFQLPQQMIAFYHQKWDRPEVLTLEPLDNVLKLSLEWLRARGE